MCKYRRQPRCCPNSRPRTATRQEPRPSGTSTGSTPRSERPRTAHPLREAAPEHHGGGYLQLVHQVKQALRLGLLQPGDQLPTAREVVAQLGINPNTVLKAYRELERARLVPAQGGPPGVTERDAASPRAQPQVGLLALWWLPAILISLIA